MVIRYSGLAGTLTYRSFYAAAMWTFSEGDRTLRRVRYREPPEGVFLGGGTGRSPDLRFASRDGDCDHLAPFLGRPGRLLSSWLTGSCVDRRLG
jgi:hypothetical protein